MRHLFRTFSVLVALVLGGATAQAASEAGSHAWSTHVLTLTSGPGSAYEVVGQIPEDVAIKVLRCQRQYCLVDGDGGRGWTKLGFISFGKTSTDWPGGINPDYVSGGPVCFYEGFNYTGASFCPAANVYQDLALYNLDNRFSSVRIEGRASVAACRDRFFQSYCERIVTSQPRLSVFLAGNLSSIRLY